MFLDIPAGSSAVEVMVATPRTLASSVGSGGLDVFSTPAMIALMERAAVSAAAPFLGSGRTTVGTKLDVRHTAATVPGTMVTAEAVLLRSEGRRLEFAVRAFDPSGTIGEGFHERVVVDTARFLDRAATRASACPGDEEGRSEGCPDSR